MDREILRLTPYELALGEPEMEAELFPSILDEASKRGVDARDPEAFPLLGSVGAVLRDLLEGAGGEAGPLLRQASLLLYHGYHFRTAGCPVLLVERPLARFLVESAGPCESPDAPLDPPAPAGYVQLPRHLFWARIEEDASPEPVDGFFWTLAGDGAARRLGLLLALGLRPARPGFSIVEVWADMPVGAAPGWAAESVRPEGSDFANVLPGGEIEGLYAITSPAEALKLAELVFRHAAAHPGEEEARGEPTGDVAGEHMLPPSALPFRRLRLAEST